MGIIYLIKPKKEQYKYIYNKTDLEKRIQKNKLRPGNERVIPKANFENIKFGSFNDNDWEKTKEFEKIVKNKCFGNYKKLINTLEWLDDKNLNMDIAEKLIFAEFKKYTLQYN